MQDVVNFESKYARIVLQERFRDGSVPKPFFLFVSGGISRVSRVIDVAFDLKVVRKVERCGGSAAVVERMQVVLSLKGVARAIITEIPVETEIEAL